jgi:hypothetical protein
MSDHQVAVQQALEGNERVWFHPFKDRLAVWYGGAKVKIIDSATWEQLDMFMVRVSNFDMEEIENQVEIELMGRGFDRVGRTQNDTRVTRA